MALLEEKLQRKLIGSKGEKEEKNNPNELSQENC